MGVMNFSIPDDVKDAFNEAFAGENKSAVIAELMRRAVEERARRKRGDDFVTRMRERRSRARPVTAEEIRRAREEGRP